MRVIQYLHNNIDVAVSLLVDAHRINSAMSVDSVPKGNI